MPQPPQAGRALYSAALLLRPHQLVQPRDHLNFHDSVAALQPAHRVQALHGKACLGGDSRCRRWGAGQAACCASPQALQFPFINSFIHASFMHVEFLTFVIYPTTPNCPSSKLSPARPACRHAAHSEGGERRPCPHPRQALSDACWA